MNSISTKNSLILHTEYTFTDLFDIAEIQKLQDSFSAATGIASIITKPDGTPITEPSGFCGLCKLIRSTEKGLANCRISDSIIGSPQHDGPKIHRCFSGGLIDAGASIIVEGKHIANWLIGQILDEEFNPEDLIAYADIVGLEHDEYRKELNEVRRMSSKQFEDVCHFLYYNAQLLSSHAVRNMNLTREITRKSIVQEEMRKINAELINQVTAKTNQLEDLNHILHEKVTEKQQVQIELDKEKLFSEAVLNSIPALIFCLDENENMVRWNKKQYLDMTGYSEEEFLHLNSSDWLKVAQNGHSTLTEEVHEALLEGHGEIEAYIHRKDGTTIPVYYTAVRMDFMGQQYLTGIGIDITHRKESEEKILYLSYHDELTGLYNRRYYEEEIRRLDTERNLPITLVIGDVNDLKLVNDAFGHNKGDELLRKAATAIKAACRSDDIVARWGGDEFVILLPKTHPEEAKEIIERIKASYSNHNVNALSISISFGSATKTNSDQNILKTLKNAEDKMYKQKAVQHEEIRTEAIYKIINRLHENSPAEKRHSGLVRELCGQLAEALDLPEIAIQKIKDAAFLHDIGKISIKEEILNKTQPLSTQERNDLMQHPDVGYRILCTSFETLEFADAVSAHHEKWDGSGYPKGLKGEAIPFEARILALANSYAEMISERSDKSAISEVEAIREIKKNAGVHFDPAIAKVFVEKVLNKRALMI